MLSRRHCVVQFELPSLFLHIPPSQNLTAATDLATTLWNHRSDSLRGRSRSDVKEQFWAPVITCRARSDGRGQIWARVLRFVRNYIASATSGGEYSVRVKGRRRFFESTFG